MTLSKTQLFAKVIVDAPLPELDYRIPDDMLVAVGDRVLVPLGVRKVPGIVVEIVRESELDPKRIKKIAFLLTDTPPMPQEWLEFTRFAAQYYKREWGEAAVQVLPPFFRKKPGVRYAQSLAKIRELKKKDGKAQAQPMLNEEQETAVEAIMAARGFERFVLHGVTGSGKTEVYLNAMQKVLDEDEEAQVLLMVPEINLTPQLEARVRARFDRYTIVTMNSDLTQTERARSWLAVHEGRARVLVGTRMAVFASFRKLALIIVDEEHDASYKAGDGLRYSARDLAIKRAHMNSIACVLGSATPSLETWAMVRDERARLLSLKHRAVQGASLPKVEIVDTRNRKFHIFSGDVRLAIEDTLQKGRQVLVFINRRGYAPTINCTACGWVSRCLHCSGFTVYHKRDRALVCHHCGTRYPIVQRCPSCGNPEIEPIGSGTERIEEAIANEWPEARVLRIDRDSVKAKGEADKAFALIHRQEADIIVGTQMIAKGHDFQHVGLVVVLNADAQLASPDIRAEERLFAVMMQVAGRAGRAGGNGRVMIQSRFPEHPIFDALLRQDYEAFGDRLLQERRESFSPPFVYQALLRAEARTLDKALHFLQQAFDSSQEVETETVRLYDPVPMALMRLMDAERAQLLVEADSRAELQRFLNMWKGKIVAESGVEWSIEVDPQEL